MAFLSSLELFDVPKRRAIPFAEWLRHRKIPGKASVFVWRIEYQKQSFPHRHILFCRDFDTQDIRAVETLVHIRYSKGPPFLEHEGLISDFRKLINSYQIHHHSKRCRLPDGKCRAGYPHEISDQT
jgi:hypothetical protein